MGSSVPSAPIIAIFGPTSSGKTALSVELAQRVAGELGKIPVIISADSRQVYKYMDIGTSKTTAAEMGGIRHEMIDVTEPARRLEMEDYVRAARGHIARSLTDGGLPLVVGGTGVYVKGLLEGWDVADTGGLRRSLRKDFPRTMAQDAHAMLRRLDKAAAAKTHPNNYESVINALVRAMSGNEPARRGARFLVLGLNPPARVIDIRVAETYDAQVRRGLLREVHELAARYDLDREMRRNGKNSTNQVLHTHGYREYFEVASERGKAVTDLASAELEEVRTRVVDHIRAYTRHQRAWLRKLSDPVLVRSTGQAFAATARAIQEQSDR